MTATIESRAAKAKADAGPEAERARERAELARAREAVESRTATPAQVSAVLDAESRSAGVMARRRESARELLETVAALKREGIALPTSALWADEHRAAVETIEAQQSPRVGERFPLDAEGNRTGAPAVPTLSAPRAASTIGHDSGRMTASALQALAYGAAMTAVRAQAGRGWKLDRGRAQEVTADLSSELVLTVLSAGRFPQWADAPGESGTPRERWTAHLVQMGGTLTSRLRREEERERETEAAEAAEETAERLRQEAPRMAALVDVACNALRPIGSSSERRALLAAVDGRTAADRAADSGRTAGAERVACTAGRKALNVRRESGALDAARPYVLDALDAQAELAEGALTRDVLKLAGWTRERVELNVSTGRAHYGAERLAQALAAAPERRAANALIPRAERARYGSPAQVLAHIELVLAQAEAVDAAQAERESDRAAVRAERAAHAVAVMASRHQAESTADTGKLVKRTERAAQAALIGPAVTPSRALPSLNVSTATERAALAQAQAEASYHRRGARLAVPTERPTEAERDVVIAQAERAHWAVMLAASRPSGEPLDVRAAESAGDTWVRLTAERESDRRAAYRVKLARHLSEAHGPYARPLTASAAQAEAQALTAEGWASRSIREREARAQAERVAASVESLREALAHA